MDESHQLNYDFIKRLKPEGEVGCIIQCSLEYPVALHNYHSDYPLAPLKKSVPYGMLSPVSTFSEKGDQECPGHDFLMSRYAVRYVSSKSEA